MKKSILFMSVLIAGIGSQAEIRVQWLASSGFYFNSNPNIGILGEMTGNSTVAQLIYSLDGNVDDVLIGGSRANDTVMDWITLTEDGVNNFDGYAYFSAINFTDPIFTAGYVYAVIFQNSSIGLNDWYYYTTPISLSDLTGSDSPQTIEMNTDLVNGNAIDFGSNVAQVIPEPATALLFILGSMGAWLVRRNNKMKADAEAEA